ncbi:flagellar export chaperone FliS [Clostridium estertheticum]|uniref:Flagellar secretion chaperone FliS n=3 Tax=Clostridium estertheticum TaxID=238834 RepID=A0A1J0GMV4_9CLOT|nr:flagellar export chaperone FliS [Clostridium estertheticum]APC42714.1 flagellar export chaperone FliS [Clostridium estertheticum subsp. estertheticum]MBU3074185.1 flagellar export chaperone FliS [Clostridium estertheticum]MBU3164279.1 flagellar export chaperone FliS [Clostridium estertheticum]MPQ32562.1 flagellar export chaperone FliS [Clostridium estertheticum]MPQ63221.1 flagellar export chaperone FliS [Clostridium estertheticum]
MNAYGNAFNTYKSNSVNFASKDQLLLMLVDGAAKFAKIGKQAILEKDVKKAHENIVKTQNIFYELMATLDVEMGGEWAKSLMKVYDFIIRRLMDANIKKSEEIMNEVIPLIDDVRDTWNEAYKKSKGGK